MTDRTHLPLPTRRMLTLKQAAQFINMPLAWFRREMPVPPTRLGRELRWDKNLLDAWLDRQANDTVNLTGKDWLGMMD